jgi:hypothetical protein
LDEINVTQVDLNGENTRKISSSRQLSLKMLAYFFNYKGFEFKVCKMCVGSLQNKVNYSEIVSIKYAT